jgi:BirA family biotin operon repressor/biotin-[acetyl-CoA-carboxylase] ligase
MAAWRAEDLWQQLEPQLPGLTVEVLAETGSTNTTLLERIRKGDAAPSLLVAEAQTQGRGRLGRQWQSEPGASLTFSLCLPVRAADWSGLSLAVGLALAEALDPLLPGQAPRIGLKWPNDLMLMLPGEPMRKLGGILIESLPAGGQRMAIIGMGLNIAPVPMVDGMAAWSQGRAHLQALHAQIDAPAALHRVAAPLLAMLRAFEQGGFAPLRTRFALRDVLLGQTLNTTLAETPQGVADGIDDDGALVLRVAGRRVRLASGEVSVRVAVPDARQESAC